MDALTIGIAVVVWVAIIVIFGIAVGTMIDTMGKR